MLTAAKDPFLAKSTSPNYVYVYHTSNRHKSQVFCYKYFDLKLADVHCWNAQLTPQLHRPIMNRENQPTNQIEAFCNCTRSYYL